MKILSSLEEWKDNIKAIGFDVDGTLYNAPDELENYFMVNLREKIFEKMSENLGLSLSEVEDIYRKKKKLLGSNTATMESFGFDGRKFFQDLFDKFPLEKYLSKDNRLVSMLNYLASCGYRLFLLSNGVARQVESKLNSLGIDKSLFESFVCCYEYGWVKPQKEPFEKILNEMNLDSSECFYVGDRCETDADGASSVGMKVGIIGKVCSRADITLDSIYEVADIFKDVC